MSISIGIEVKAPITELTVREFVQLHYPDVPLVKEQYDEITDICMNLTLKKDERLLFRIDKEQGRMPEIVYPLKTLLSSELIRSYVVCQAAKRDVAAIIEKDESGKRLKRGHTQMSIDQFVSRTSSSNVPEIVTGVLVD